MRKRTRVCAHVHVCSFSVHAYVCPCEHAFVSARIACAHTCISVITLVLSCATHMCHCRHKHTRVGMHACLSRCMPACRWLEMRAHFMCVAAEMHVQWHMSSSACALTADNFLTYISMLTPVYLCSSLNYFFCRRKYVCSHTIGHTHTHLCPRACVRGVVMHVCCEQA